MTEKAASVKHHGRQTTDSQIPNGTVEAFRKCDCTTYMPTKSESDAEISEITEWCLEKDNHIKLGKEKDLLL